MLGQWGSKLCEDGGEVFEEEGAGAEWVEDAGGECCIFSNAEVE